ncbi:MAG: hypothetical protein VX815_13785 [Gemmatimonadota bacterium]|nr:hypothetical protein [Gemmatimonadota bacterium]
MKTTRWTGLLGVLVLAACGADEDTWRAMSLAMIEVGRVAIAAAEAKNTAAVFDADAEVYAVCSACHATYALGTIFPSDLPGN